MKETNLKLHEIVVFWEIYKIKQDILYNHATFCGFTGTEKYRGTKEKFFFYQQYTNADSTMHDYIDRILEIYEEKISAPLNFGCEWRFPEYITNDPVKNSISLYLPDASFSLYFLVGMDRIFYKKIKNQVSEIPEIQQIKNDPRWQYL